MSGWRDEDGHTAAERKKLRRGEDRARLAAEVRHRPLSFLKTLAGFALAMILVLALIAAFR